MANEIAEIKDSSLGIVIDWNVTDPDPDWHIFKVTRRRLLDQSLNSQTLIVKGLHAFI